MALVTVIFTSSTSQQVNEYTSDMINRIFLRVTKKYFFLKMSLLFMFCNLISYTLKCLAVKACFNLITFLL